MSVDINVARLTAGDIVFARAALDLFGDVFDEVDTYSANQPDDSWLMLYEKLGTREDVLHFDIPPA